MERAEIERAAWARMTPEIVRVSSGGLAAKLRLHWRLAPREMERQASRKWSVVAAICNDFLSAFDQKIKAELLLDRLLVKIRARWQTLYWPIGWPI